MNRERQREVTIHACMHTHIQLVRSTVEIPCNNNIRISREGERERERELKIHSVTKKKSLACFTKRFSLKTSLRGKFLFDIYRTKPPHVNGVKEARR